MDSIPGLIVVIIIGVSVWSSIHFWMSGRYKRDRPNPTLSGFRPDDNSEHDR